MDNVKSAAPTAFTPDTVAMINRAYARACEFLGSEVGNEALRPKLGAYMLDLARSGERDEGRLCGLSLLATVGRKSMNLSKAS